MKKQIKALALSAFALLFISISAKAQEIGKNEFNPIQTGVTSLGITPDARGASMGDLGVATDPDANSQFWNPSKYAFAYSKASASLSYTPWLRKLVNDIFLANLAGYWKLGSDDNQAVSASIRYFSLGEVNTSDGEGYTTQSLNPYEMAVDLGYSRKLSDSYSMGIVFRYIYSDLGFSDSYAGDQTSGASAFAADISGYYTSYPIIGRNECQWSLGWNISNIGSKVSYNNGEDPAFLPTNLRIGTAFTFPLADYHNLTLAIDLNKLLVPTRPREMDFDDTPEGQQAYLDALEEWENMSPISGIFKSFNDAPGGMKEELREITYSIGAEYSYNQQFFLRAGYFHENEFKGNRQYFGLGAGFALNVLRLDASYMVATAQTSPLDQTLRFTLSFDMDGLKEIFGKK
ncbi:MAG: type IX secretion system outer membrane channel protein PorV [Muribaculaceae bacterium]|nr:type IX secretion system outer membrane channel protein PorV [Muribaculaceae bacterium]